MIKTASLLFCLFVLIPIAVRAQEKTDSELFKTLESMDKLLFTVAFNKCDIPQLTGLVSDNFEFYHDVSGVTPSKADFIKSVENNLCKAPNKPRRELVEGSLEVYPLKDKGVLYGAVQTGRHRFYVTDEGKPERLTGIAKFMHVWKLEDGKWKILRVISYDHQTAE